MIDILIPFFGLFLLAILAALFLSGMSWYRRKELNELREVEFKIIAQENNRNYSKQSTNLARYLQTLELFPGRKGRVFNLFDKQYSNFTSYIFDSVYVKGSGKSKKTMMSVGVAVDLNHIDIPRFSIRPTKPFDSFTFLRSMKKVKKDFLPTWLTQQYSVFRHRSISDASIQSIIDNNDDLHQLFVGLNIHLLAGREQTVVFYQRGTLPVSSPYFQGLEEKVRVLALAFDEHAIEPNDIPDTNINDEIMMLKQGEKG